jgi:hypothetical protein
VFDNPTASQSVFSMGTGTEFSGVHLPLLRFHEVLDDVLNCNTVLAELSPTLARLERVLDFQVLSKSSVGVIPCAKVVHSTADLLGPFAARMGEQPKVGVRFVGLGAFLRHRVYN